MIDRQNVFNEQVKNDLITYANVQELTIGQGDDYTTGCLLDYPYFNRNLS